MLGVYVTIPVACFRKGLAREYLETEPLPPPATCYGFLLSLVGETNRCRHLGCRVTPVLKGKPPTSVILRTVWRVKKVPLGSSGNTRPDYQQLLTNIELVIWLDSSQESGERLEDRVRLALENPAAIGRFGGLSLGESTHLVDEVTLVERVVQQERQSNDLPKRVTGLKGRAFLLAPYGRHTLPVWVDHVGSTKTRFVTGDLIEHSLEEAPDSLLMPKIESEQG